MHRPSDRLSYDVVIVGAGHGGAQASIALTSGEVMPCERVIVGIGISPQAEPLLAARAPSGGGVDVHAQCRTSLSDIYPIGDCAAKTIVLGQHTPAPNAPKRGKAGLPISRSGSQLIGSCGSCQRWLRVLHKKPITLMI